MGNLSEPCEFKKFVIEDGHKERLVLPVQFQRSTTLYCVKEHIHRVSEGRKTQFLCKCGGKIDLTTPMAAYQFGYPYCGKHDFGTTNILDLALAIRCTCGGMVDLYWNKCRKGYFNR